VLNNFGIYIRPQCDKTTVMRSPLYRNTGLIHTHWVDSLHESHGSAENHKSLRLQLFRTIIQRRHSGIFAPRNGMPRPFRSNGHQYLRRRKRVSYRRHIRHGL